MVLGNNFSLILNFRIEFWGTAFFELQSLKPPLPELEQWRGGCPPSVTKSWQKLEKRIKMDNKKWWFHFLLVVFYVPSVQPYLFRAINSDRLKDISMIWLNRYNMDFYDEDAGLTHLIKKFFIRQFQTGILDTYFILNFL